MNYSGLIKKVAAVALLFTSVNVNAQQTQTADSVKAETVEFKFDSPIMDSSTPKRYYLRKVNFHGANHYSHAMLQNITRLNPGDSIYLPSNVVQNVISTLWAQRQFADVKVGATLDGEEVEFEIFLKERPRVYKWLFSGISKGQQKDITESLQLKPGGELSDYAIDKNTKLIKEYYREKGFRNATVDVQIDNIPEYAHAVAVTFNINRGERVKIGEINFSGNTEFADKNLRKAFKSTHQKSINIFKSAKLKDDDFKTDKELLIDYYNSKGFRNAAVIKDSIYTINEKRIGIAIDVVEGNKFYIRDVSWVGNSIYETDYLQNIFSVNKGDTYDKKSMHKRLGIGREADPEGMSVSSLYQNKGYLMSQVEPSEVIVGADSIDIEVKIFEGKPFTINNVNITGNNRIDDEVIRREIYTRPGELYDRSLLMQTIRTLGGMQHFNAETIMPDIQPVSNELVDISWPLEEVPSDQFNIAGGFGSDTFVGSIAVTLNNLSVKNMFDKGAWRPYPMGQNQRLTISGQTNGTYYKALSLSFTDPWLGGKKPNSFTVSGHYSESNDAYYAWQSSTMHFRTYGLAAGFGKRLTWPDPYFTFYSEFGYERYNLKNWSSFIMQNGNANSLSMKLVLSRNSVDQPIYPRRGSEFTASVQFTPPYSLWDGKDYESSELSEEERYKWIEYHKWSFKAQWYQALSQNQNLVLMAKAEMGYLGNYNQYKPSPFERYEVGGDGMTGYNIYGVDIIGMRGYEDGALNPLTNQYGAAGYNKYTVELRYPIILKPSSQIYVLGFMEGGNAFDSWQSFSPFKIKRSAGFGVRLFLPVVGTLGIDWGYGFDPAAGTTEKSGSQFHFVMGQQF